MNRQMWALTTDFWRSRWLQVVGTLLLPMLLPILLYGPLFSLADYDWQHDPSSVMMHVVLTGIIVLCAVGTLLTWFDSLQREFTLPITAWQLVITRSISGALVAAATYALACLLTNWLYQADWPLLGPVLLAVTVYLAAQAACLLLMKSQALGLALLPPLCLVSAWWFVARYETGGLDPAGTAERLQMWSHVTGSEWLTLLLVSVGGVWGSYCAARLQRIGLPPMAAGSRRRSGC